MRLKHVKGAEEIIKKGIYYIDNPKEYKGKWDNVFKNNHPIHIEIGMGKGDFIIENAIKYPNINFIGIEKYDSVLVRGIQKSNNLLLNNLKLIRIDANIIEEIFTKEIDTIYLNFSDPWPKDRHAKRRLTSPIFLDKYEKIFKKDNNIIIKTYNTNLFEYSKETLKEKGYHIQKETNNLYHSKYLENNIQTEYEKKFVNLGVKINYLDAYKKIERKEYGTRR